MVVVSDLHKSFGPVYAVRGVSFELAPGQIAGLLGHNGAGKTTTIRMIAGFLTPDVGHVSIDGFHTVNTRQEALARLGYLPESNPLYPEMAVPEYLEFRARLFGVPRAARSAAVERVIERCWLSEVRTRRISTLSKGYKQRVGLAAALLHNPPVLLLDEPTNGLDPTQIHETRGLIKELSHDRTVLISSHILPEIERVCDRVIIFAGGKVGADGSPADLARGVGVKAGRGNIGGSYTLEAKGASTDAFERALRETQGVSTFQSAPADGWTRWTIHATPAAGDLREELARTASTHALSVRELRAERASLERVFMTVLEHAGELQ
ncbi:MAG TPA: ABC transporter ATP-binding protein [Phycisphaerales bacterium]|nr:ABC transporter ATP-binding protein [Phycisphaerales bacterium]